MRHGNLVKPAMGQCSFVGLSVAHFGYVKFQFVFTIQPTAIQHLTISSFEPCVTRHMDELTLFPVMRCCVVRDLNTVCFSGLDTPSAETTDVCGLTRLLAE